MLIFSNIIFILYLSQSVVSFTHPDEYKLEQLQVLFRHGDRTPNKPEIFESDPYDEIYKSYGYGQLTKVGKNREYKIGQILRERYNDFLGEFKNDDIYAYSTDLDRTRISLQLVLAGLYPPTPSTSWSNSVNWQPIPTHYEPWTSGFLTAAFDCPKFKKLFHDVANFPEIQALTQEHESFFRDIESKNGIKITSIFTAWNVYSNLRAALSLGLPLPLGFSDEDFQKLEKLTSVVFKSMTYTDQLRRMMAGPMVERFLKVFKDEESSKKMYLYGGHEFNVAAFVDSHNITDAPIIHDYGSALILEKLRGPDDRLYVRVYLWTGASEKLISLKVTNCDRTCLLSDYEKIVQSILPNQMSIKICTSSTTLCRRRIESDDNEIDPDIQLAYFFAGSDLSSFKYSKEFSSYVIERS